MPGAGLSPLQRTKDGVTLRVRLTPKASHDQFGPVIDTPDGPAVSARVRALPRDGAANTALITLAAKWLRLPKSSLFLAAGAKSRTKTIAIAGDPEALADRVADKLHAV